MSERERGNILLEKSFSFALEIVQVYKYLTKEQSEFILSKQLLRSGTAVGAMIREAQNAESKMDFIHKLAIAQKECDESRYWLELLLKSAYLSQPQFEQLHAGASELLKLLRSIILTTRNNLKK